MKNIDLYMLMIIYASLWACLDKQLDNHLCVKFT